MEDNPGLARLLQRRLSRHGYQVDLARDGAEGLAKLDTGENDVLILDQMMPVYTGLQVIQILAQRGPVPPTVMVTGTGSEQIAVEALKLGALDYVVKDVDGGYLELLPAVIEQALWRHQLAEERDRLAAELLAYSELLEERVAERTSELEEAHEQLVRREKLAVLGQIAGGVGHDLRNPLGAITNAVYLLEGELPEASETARELIEIIGQETERAEGILTDLLNYARTTEAVREPLSPSYLVELTAQRLPPPEGIDLRIEIAPDLPDTLANPRQMVQVLTNLVSNAYQAMDREGTLTLCAEVEGDEVLLHVRDTGPGIDPAHMKHLFDPLFTTKEMGIGLGLPTAQNLVEANGGRIEVESKVEVGCTFTVRMPAIG